MQTKKAKYHLKRIETILNLHEDSLSSLDRDILLEDIRHLYDLVLNAETAHPLQESTAPRDHAVVQPERPAVVPPESDPQSRPETVSYKDENTPSPSNDQNKLDAQPKESPVSTPPGGIPMTTSSEEPVVPRDHPHTPTTVTFEESTRVRQEYREQTPDRTDSPISPKTMNGRTETTPAHLAEEDSHVETLTEEAQQSYPDLFDFPVSSDLSDRLGNSKIEHLNRILTINDKILFINHLFGGEAIPFQESLKKFEGFYTYEEAIQYASRDLVVQYQWTDADKYDTVRQFMKQVKRLYN